MQSIADTYVRKGLVILIAVAALSLGVHAHAQEGAGAANRPQLSERLQERIINLVSNVQNRTNAAVGRLENISGRIDSRMSKLEAEGIDTMIAQERHSEGVEAIEQAKRLSASLTTAQSALSSDDPKESFGSIVSTFQQIRRSLIDARQALTDTTNIMRELKAAQDNEA